MESIQTKTVEIVAKHLPSLDDAIKLASPDTLDGRDATRLAQFVPQDRLGEIGLTVKDGETHEPVEWNAENVAKQIASDVDFAFDKALGMRGISASLMNDVLQMWHRILRPPFEVPGYAQYGLPLCKEMAVYFDLPNRIGDNDGDESQYSSAY